eukprot:GEMP01055823.1.p1 GENE.GEMP01055823.1~~GEMP01055823.1.p1  ORF type:complete len:298 (+),score=98.76 GEMP01055823.1:107-1000(+)
MTSVQVHYVGARRPTLLHECVTVGSIMVRLADERERFASDVVVFPLGTDTVLTHDSVPPCEVSVVLKHDTGLLDESECHINILLYAEGEDVRRLTRVLAMLAMVAPESTWPEMLLEDVARDAQKKDTIARTLIAAGVDGAMALKAASDNGDIGAINHLLAAGLSPNCPMPFGCSALILASSKGHTAVVRLLLASNAKVNHVDAQKCSALTRAATWERVDIVELLLAAKATVNHADKFGNCALSLASQAGRKDVVDLLLSAGAQVNPAMHIGRSPLMVASTFGHQDVVNALLSAGAIH